MGNENQASPIHRTPVVSWRDRDTTVHRIRSRFRTFTLGACLAVMSHALPCQAIPLTDIDGKLLPQFQDPHGVVTVFLEAVARGELVVFDRTLDKGMLIPVRVEYAYGLDGTAPVIKVYVTLKQPLSLPGHETFVIHGVSTIISTDGRILEIISHVKMRQGIQLTPPVP